jgi:two-component system, sensor histidine kinase PdtaS
LRSRLPERLSDRLPPLLVEVGVGLLLAIFFGLLRLALVPWAQDRAPYAFVFLAVVGSAVLAGWRSGLIALVAGQVLTLYFIIAPRATLSELLVLAIIALYQREVERAWSVREGQMNLLEKALKEIDHRTSNNYQTMLALVLTQASSSEGKVRDALVQVADRIRGVADAQRKLAVASISLERVLIGEHLQALCAGLERGMAGPGVRLETEVTDFAVDAGQAACVSILVNELVTNAFKHAFPDGRGGTIRVALTGSNRELELHVEDDGVGMNGSAASRGTGLGTRLVDTFVRQLRGRHEVKSDASGTRHRIRFPATR